MAFENLEETIYKNPKKKKKKQLYILLLRTYIYIKHYFESLSYYTLIYQFWK